MVDQLSESQFNQVRISSNRCPYLTPLLLPHPPYPKPLRIFQLKEAFALLDTDGDGILTSNDVQVLPQPFAASATRIMSHMLTAAHTSHITPHTLHVTLSMQLFLTSFNHSFNIDEIESFLSECLFPHPFLCFSCYLRAD